MARHWLGGMTTLGLALNLALSSWADDPKPKDPAQPRVVVADPALAARVSEVRREFEAQQEVCRKAAEAAKTEAEAMEIYGRLTPDDTAFSRRMIDLALTKPNDPASRDALVWVLDKVYRIDMAGYGDEFARAAALLVRYHADDPEAVAVAFNLANGPTSHRDAFLFGLVATAKERATKGMARLALAHYLAKKVEIVEAYHGKRDRVTMKYINATLDADGKRHDLDVPEPDEQYADRLANNLLDVNALRAEVDRLLHEVVADYGDVPYRTTTDRRIEELLRNPNPTWNGRPLSAEEHQKLEVMARSKTTLKDVAEAYLDELTNIVEGKPAPPIEGTDADGKPLRLADYRGKVVVLVFWGSWCGPCLAEVPHERAIVSKYRDRPVAVLGVNCNDKLDAARKAIADNTITWPNWIDGDNGPIQTKYHVGSFPTVAVIDGSGTLRAKNTRGDGLDMMIDKLLAEMAGAK